MKTLRSMLSLAACAATVLLSTTAHAQSTRMTDGKLVDASGMTLYTFDKDVAGSGKSACNGPCATLWPALMANTDAKAAGDHSIVTRDDGSKQWAYKGKPVYLYSADKKAGDATGDNFKDVWHVVK